MSVRWLVGLSLLLPAEKHGPCRALFHSKSATVVVLVRNKDTFISNAKFEMNLYTLHTCIEIPSVKNPILTYVLQKLDN